jgi:hypothetical protein
MMKMLNRDTALVTVGQVAAKRDLREKKVSQRDALNVEIDQLDKWLEAATILAGTDIMAHTAIAEEEEDSDQDGAGENMAEAAKRILGNFPKGVGHAQLQDELKKIPLFAERLSKNPGYYYTMISRLKKRGHVVKYRKLLRLPQQPTVEDETAA